MSKGELLWICAGVFVPLFPLSMIFNAALAAARWVWVRVVMVLIWPQLGLWCLSAAEATTAFRPAHWTMSLGLATALLYAWRMLSVRALSIWVGFWVTSAWALAWVALVAGVPGADLRIAMAGVSLTAAALVCGVGALDERWGEAYLGLRCGLGRQAPRLAGVLVGAMLAALGAPVLPVFFVMLWLVRHADGYGVAGVLAVWLLWSWSVAGLWQGLLFGIERKETDRFHEEVTDLSMMSTGVALLLGIVSAGAAMVWSTRWLIH
jgi:hypothetical protein